MNGAKILVIDDEKSIRRLLENILLESGYTVFLAETAEKALYQVKNKHPDLILLDLNLPDMFGGDLLKKIRELYNTPIIAVTVLNSDEEKENILDLGADDFITKPFSAKELLARVRVALRHSVNLKIEPVYKNGPLTVDFNLRQAFIESIPIKLTANEFDVLKVLIANEGKIITQTHILREVWGPAAIEQGHYVRIYVANLRRKLEAFASMDGFIKTEQGVGYRIDTLKHTI